MDEQEKNEAEKMREEIEQIKAEYNGAKKILQEVKLFENEFQTLKGLLSDETNGIQANFNFSKTQKEHIEALATLAQNNSDSIAISLQKVETNIASMQTSYSEFTEIKGKISGISGEIDTLLTSSRSLHVDITAVKKDALDTLEGIKTTYQTVAGNIADIKAAYQEFLQIRSKIDDKATGLQAIFDAVQSLNKQSNTIFTEIKTFRDNAKIFLSDIEKNKETSDELKANIQTNLEYTEEKKTQIEKATGLIIDTSFAETFKKRQVDIENGLKVWYSWKNVFFVSVALLVVFVVLPYTKLLDFGTLPWYELFLSRIYYTSPVLFLITFSAIQYSKERDLAEKYAFKAASSSAIRSHVDYLIEKFEKDEECKVLDFAKETFATIYKEPYSTHDGLEKRIKKLEEMQELGSMNHQINIDEIVESVKELKELIPETSVFEKVISIFIKK